MNDWQRFAEAVLCQSNAEHHERTTMGLTVDNRNLVEIESYLRDRIDAMKRERDEIRRKIECRGWTTLDALLANYDELTAGRGVSSETRK